MAHSPLSPKKYIETKARSLPLYKCYVNRDWQQSKLANVFVIRKHVTGNLTAGVYLVDLLCLGVKDSLFYFNEAEEEVSERIPLDYFEEISYPLAHNIIYAGHDFAMEFDIHPCAKFATTKFILEEDDDSIELIDIEVGDEEGRPFLMLNKRDKNISALDKLKKNAGEGNYFFTIEGYDDRYDDEYEKYDEEEEYDAYEGGDEDEAQDGRENIG